MSLRRGANQLLGLREKLLKSCGGEILLEFRRY